MSIQETTRQALSLLFTDQTATDPAGETEAQDSPETPADSDAEAVLQDTPEERPRQNGIIEQDYNKKGFHLDVQIPSDQLVQATRIIFDLGFFIESITGVDWIKEDQLEVVYDYSRYDFDLCRLVIRVRIPRQDPHLPTITDIYTGASWHERETHDFFGVVFDGHPHLIPLLLPEDADFHPLLKDFKA